MNDETLRTADLWRSRGDDVALATVVRTRRSAPRPLGAKFAVGSRGEMAGSVSGGCVEGAVVEEAQSVLAGGPPKLLFYGIADDEAWDVGLACGGEIWIWVERYDGWETPVAPRAARVTVIDGEHAGEHLFVTEEGVQRRRAGGALGAILAAGQEAISARAQPDDAARRRQHALRRGARAASAPRGGRRRGHGGLPLPHGGARSAGGRSSSTRGAPSRPRARPVGRSSSS